MIWVRCHVCDAQLKREPQKGQTRFFCARPKDCFQLFMRQRPAVHDYHAAVGVWIVGGRKGPRPRAPYRSEAQNEQVKSKLRAAVLYGAVSKAKRRLQTQQADAVVPQEPPPPPGPIRFVEDMDPADDPRFGRRSKKGPR